MMRSLFSGVSGLKSHQTRMDVIGNNIANINTVGFKSSRTTFSDMLSQTTRGAAGVTTNLGGTNPLQIGLGTAVASIDLITNDGSPQSTGKNTDVALSGNGMFVLKNGDQYYYSRDGAFEFDEEGNYVLPGSGLYVQGWNAVDGSLNTNSDPTNIVVPAGRSMEAAATSTVDFSGNLNASAPTIVSISYTQGGAGAKPENVVNGDHVTGMSYSYSFTQPATNTTITYTVGTSTANSTGTDADGNTVTYSGTAAQLLLTLADGTTATETTSGAAYELGGTYSDGQEITSLSVVYTGTQTVDSTDENSYRVNQSMQSVPTVTVAAVNTANGTYDAEYVESITSTANTYNYSTDSDTTKTIAGITFNLVSYTVTRQGLASITIPDASGVWGDNTDLQIGATLAGGNITSIVANYEAVGVTAGYSDTMAVGDTVASTSAVSITQLNLTVTDLTGNTSTATVTSGATAYAIGDVYGSAKSVNVDGQNVIAAVLTLSDGSTQKVTSGFYQVGHSMPITTIVTLYDSEGKKHAVTVLLDKDAESTDPAADGDADKTELGVENRWRVYIAPAVNEMGPSSKFIIDEDDGSRTWGFFNPTSTTELDSDTGLSLPTDGAVSYIYFNSDGSYSSAATDGGSLYLVYGNGNGAAPTTSSVNFTGLTQFAGSSTAYPTADGNSYGVLQSVSIDSSGILTGTYTNGTRRFEAQIAVAQFINSAGLTKTGTSLYQESNNSGAANIKTVTDLGLSITPSALEMSNVDLASELADMIVTQRGFQSNSKIISVGDEMLETLINMKR